MTNHSGPSTNTRGGTSRTRSGASIRSEGGEEEQYHGFIEGDEVIEETQDQEGGRTPPHGLV